MRTRLGDVFSKDLLDEPAGLEDYFANLLRRDQRSLPGPLILVYRGRDAGESGLELPAAAMNVVDVIGKRIGHIAICPHLDRLEFSEASTLVNDIIRRFDAAEWRRIDGGRRPEEVAAVFRGGLESRRIWMYVARYRNEYRDTAHLRLESFEESWLQRLLYRKRKFLVRVDFNNSGLKKQLLDARGEEGELG